MGSTAGLHCTCTARQRGGVMQKPAGLNLEATELCWSSTVCCPVVTLDAAGRVAADPHGASMPLKRHTQEQGEQGGEEGVQEQLLPSAAAPASPAAAAYGRSVSLVLPTPFAQSGGADGGPLPVKRAGGVLRDKHGVWLVPAADTLPCLTSLPASTPTSP